MIYKIIFIKSSASYAPLCSTAMKSDLSLDKYNLKDSLL